MNSAFTAKSSVCVTGGMSVIYDTIYDTMMLFKCWPTVWDTGPALSPYSTLDEHIVFAEHMYHSVCRVLTQFISSYRDPLEVASICFNSRLNHCS